MEKIEDVRREIDATREQMAATAAEIESRIQGRFDAVKQKLDVADHVRSHPWPALAIALIAGAAVAASGSDRKAVAATARVAKRAPRATAKAAKATATGAVHLAGSAVSRIRGRDDGHDNHRDDDDDGFFGRLKAKFSEQARELGEHLGRAADDLMKSSAPRRGTAAGLLESGTPHRSTADDSYQYDRSPGDTGIGITTPYPPISAD